MRKHLILLSVLFLILPLLFLGCEGDDGATGAAGADGTPGVPGPGALANETCNLCHGDGKIADVAVVHDAADDLASLTVTINSVVIPNAATTGGPPTVNFTVTDPDGTGTDVAGFSQGDFSFTIAKLVPGTSGDADSWQNYSIWARLKEKAGLPPGLNVVQGTDESNGTLVNNGGGTYTYTYATGIDNVLIAPPSTRSDSPNSVAVPFPVPYEPTLTHRVGLQRTDISGAPQANGTFDFVPDGSPITLTRNVVAIESCNECHRKLAVHSSRRIEVKYCVTCHNPGSSDSLSQGLTIDAKVFWHKLHRGKNLPSVVAGGSYIINDHDYSAVGLPQDVRNCTKCHDNTKASDADNWKERPTREACGSCHDDVNFETGEGHLGGPQPNNSGCALCHQADVDGAAPAISNSHATENVTPNNQDLPVGLSRFEYFLDNVAVDNNGLTTVGFRITRDGAPFDLDDWVAGEGTTFTNRSPSFLLAWALPQDGIDAPAEYNNRTSPDPPSGTNGNGAGDAPSVSLGALITDNLVTGTAAGYTAVLDGRPPVSDWTTPGFPTGATMRAVALQSYFNQIVGTETIGRHTPSVMRPVDPDDARRVVVKSGYTGDPAAGGQPFGCLECHETLELHGGSRVNNPQVCVFCHNPNKSSSGRTADPSQPSYSDPENGGDPEDDAFLVYGTDPLEWPEATNNFKNMIHGIHAATDRPFEFVRNRRNGIVYNWSHVTFPGDLRFCEKCHIGKSYVPSNVPANALWNVERTTTGNPAETMEDIIAARSSVPNLTDLVDSPIAGACYYCHDDGTAESHILLQGGKLSIWPNIDTQSGATTREYALGLP